MKERPPLPRIEDAPQELLESGHLWLTELIDGATLRIQLRESGLLRFGDSERVYDDPDAIPLSYRRAVRHVRERLDRDRLRRAVDDVESVVLFGAATRYGTIEYDWDRLPPFLGVGVWAGDTGRFLPPDATERTFDRLGLDPINAVERELNTRDFDPDSYVVPDSAWYDGPAKGVVVRNKKGGRAKLLDPEFHEIEGPSPVEASAEKLAERYATDRRFETIATELRDRGDAVTFEVLHERALEDIAREEYGRLFHDGSSVDLPAFRSAVAERTGAFLSRVDE
ncbi:hypothetical protein KM295_04080 [Natronomonas sp. F2-12]|uniref:Uncharacterized protein n=1 Tax=Natronomonas aquatica TaxID=2841590 RepID=A0A9R1CRV0_9EURY|nr:hypothetical protein [Natronomonas aquatica]MCQ4332682.1 hypothetical protein [Natronomonas aquatica]